MSTERAGFNYFESSKYKVNINKKQKQKNNNYIHLLLRSGYITFIHEALLKQIYCIILL